MRFSPTISAIIPLSVSATFQDRVYSFLRNQPVTRYMFRMFKKIELAQILQFQQPDVVFSPLHIEVLYLENGSQFCLCMIFAKQCLNFMMWKKREP